MNERIQLFNDDNYNVIKTLSDESIDVICIDPPYLYLKNQKLERIFDEHKFFSECKRLLTKKGFIVMFGRGESFYRWNTMLADLGFIFKEEIVWNKRNGSSPLLPLQRMHELVTIFTKKEGQINRVKIPYVEMRKYDIDAVINDINRMKVILKSDTSFNAVLRFIEHNQADFNVKNKNKHKLRGDCNDYDRCARGFNSMINGMSEKSIIDNIRDHYTSIHPTQKPVRLLERLLNLTIPKDKEEITVADFFAGSMSTMEAVLNLQEQNPDKIFKGIATEIDEEYFNAGKERIEKLLITEPNLFNT